MKKTLVLTLLIGALSFLSLAGFGDLSLYTSLTSAGSTAGGLRVDLGGGFVADGTVGFVDDGSGSETATYQYFADIYYGAWGLAVSGAEGSGTSISLMYAIEQAVNDKITLGIASALISVQNGLATQFINGYDIYAVLAF